MAKSKNPLFSFAAAGSLAKRLSFRRARGGSIAEKTPTHPDAKTPAQLAQRVMYQKCTDLWHTLSAAEQQTWHSLANRLHMTGYAYYMSLCLRPNPGIYLPLAGGTMQGIIDMATNKITALPAPTADEEPTRKVDLATHTALQTAVHGLKGQVGFSVYQTSDQNVPRGTTVILQWHVKEWDVGGYFDLANNRFLPLVAGKYLIFGGGHIRSAAAGYELLLGVRKNGVVYKMIGRQIPGGQAHPFIGSGCIVPLNGSTDYVDMYVYLYEPSNRTTVGMPYSTWMQGFIIAQT